MRSVAEVAAKTAKRGALAEQQSPIMPAAAEPPAIWLRRIWERQTALYGHAWVSVHGVTPHDKTGALSMSGDTWGRALAGVSAQQIAAGIEACVAEGAEFPPSAPRFRAMCLGVPILAAVRSELRRGEPSPFARATWAELDVFRYKQASAEQADRLLRDAYDLVRDRVMRGETLPELPVAFIPHEVSQPTPTTPERLKEHFARIKALLAAGEESDA